MEPLDLEIPYECPPAVETVLEQVGRTEDVRFSPSNRRLALAGFVKNSIAIAEIEIDTDGSRPRIRVKAAIELTSPSLQMPHGVEFLDDTTIIVANRRGTVAFFEVPTDLDVHSELVPVDPTSGRGFPWLHAPGSVRLARQSESSAEVFVCSHDNLLTRHIVVAGRDRLTVETSDVVLRQWLTRPDGVALSDDGWVAVSNHDGPAVYLYERSTLPDEQCDPSAVLRGINYPHGLRFGANEDYLFVADAGSPRVHVFERRDDSWSGLRYPSLSFPVMEPGVYAGGRHNAHEGGPKGLDIDGSGRVLAVTCERQRLRFFDAAEAIAAAAGRVPESEEVVKYELAVLRGTGTRIAEAEQWASALRQSRSFRITGPLRRLRSTLSTIRRRKRIP
jgi:hypothetical protein